MTASYNDLVNVATFGKKRENFETERGNLAHYCHDCAKVVEVETVDEGKGRYRCMVCHGEHIATGSEETIREFYVKKR